MTVFAVDLQVLKDTVATTLGDKVQVLKLERGEVTVTVKAADYIDAMQTLRDAPGCKFEQLIDLPVQICILDQHRGLSSQRTTKRDFARRIGKRVVLRVFLADDTILRRGFAVCDL